MLEKTVLEFTYEPATFFEAPYTYARSEYTIAIADGTVTVTLARPQDPVAANVLHMIEREVQIIFAARQLQTHRLSTRTGPATRHYHADGHQDVSLSVWIGGVLIRAAPVDDTKAERIATETQFLDMVVQKIPHPLLEALLHSYSAAVHDPANELIHLYEVREALAKHFGGEKEARTHLSIPNSEWSGLGRLANNEPVEQGRHRGQHITKRAATQEELAEVRRIVRGWIEKFATQI